MVKRKFYLILAIITIISLFSFAAICTQCGADTEDKVGTEDEIPAESKDDEIPVEEDEEATDEDSTESEDIEDEADSQEDADSEEDSDSDDAEAPTISLEVYEGPFPAESLCVYRIQANVTGSPSPSITWSKDDSGGSWGTKKAQVNLNNPSDSYTLTATATNSEGSATDSIDISWGCEEAEPEPEPEPEAEPEGGETSIFATPEISGYMLETEVFNSDRALMGDAAIDVQIKGYLSFDISGLHGKTVQDAEINFTSIRGWGNPESFASSIVVKIFNYIRLDASDFAVGGLHLATMPISAASYTISGNTLKNELQAVLDNGVRDYFQLKLGLNATTNNDGISDVARINCNEAVLYISYTD